MRKLSLVLELAPVTWDLLPSATTAITAITHMLAHLMATMVLTTLRAACSSVPARGSMASMVPATVVASTAAATTVAAAMDAATTAGAITVAVVTVAVADMGLAASEAALADFTAEAGSMAAVGFMEAPADFMVEVVADSTAAVGAVSTVGAAGPMVVAATAGDIGKTFKFHTCGEKRLAASTASRSCFQRT
jgi:hypothetical protein